MVMIDESLFRIVLENLINNAINYTQQGGAIKIECVEVKKKEKIGGKIITEDCFVIMISDNGCGILKSQQNKIFTKFFRADNTKSEHPDGTGLGLYVVKSILENSGGLIWFISPSSLVSTQASSTTARQTCQNQQQNKGTTFYVMIPIKGMRDKTGEGQLIS